MDGIPVTTPRVPPKSNGGPAWREEQVPNSRRQAIEEMTSAHMNLK
jgi:hypothetical protein